MIFNFGSRLVVFSKEVIDIFEKYKQYKPAQHESGGILLGKVYDEVIIIDQISEPSAEDKSGRFYFDRNVQKAQSIVERAWNESNGQRIYLGEWHTHPEDIPTPSRDDKKLLKNMSEKTHMQIDFLFMAIIGRIKPYVAVFQKEEKTINQLQATEQLKITIYRNQEKQVYGFQAGGYLNLAENGYDIYNAGFSLIFLGTLRSIASLTDIQNCILEEANGFIRFIIPDIEHEKAITILESMLVQTDMLIANMREKGIDKHVTLEFKN